jgi:hypothetical protein
MIVRKRAGQEAEPGAARLFGLAVLALLGFALPVFTGEITAGDAARTEGPKVFVVSREVDAGALLKTIPFIAPVATREEAQVEVLIEPKGPAPGGEFVLTFTGLREFAGKGQTLTYAPGPTETGEQVEAGLSRTLQMGLMRFVAGTPAARRVRIGLRDRVKPTDVVDRWDSWVFSASANGMFQGEKTYVSRMFFGSFSANRVTPDLKVRMSLAVSTQRDRFDYGDDEIRSRSESRGFEGLFVKSLGEHWSAGAYVSAGSSTFENVRTKVAVAPAVEYNVFPYSESTRRQLRVLYSLGFDLARYREETIYEKLQDRLLRQELEAAFEVKREWGTVSVSLEASNYFHDFRKNRLEFNSEISIRVFKGLSFYIHGGGARIRDQLSLPRRGASLDEIILQRKQLATSYNYYVMAGFSYTFGSIFSNIVNPRFGSGGGGVSISISQ